MTHSCALRTQLSLRCARACRGIGLVRKKGIYQALGAAAWPLVSVVHQPRFAHDVSDWHSPSWHHQTMKWKNHYTTTSTHVLTRLVDYSHPTSSAPIILIPLSLVAKHAYSIMRSCASPVHTFPHPSLGASSSLPNTRYSAAAMLSPSLRHQHQPNHWTPLQKTLGLPSVHRRSISYRLLIVGSRKRRRAAFKQTRDIEYRRRHGERLGLEKRSKRLRHENHREQTAT